MLMIQTEKICFLIFNYMIFELGVKLFQGNEYWYSQLSVGIFIILKVCLRNFPILLKNQLKKSVKNFLWCPNLMVELPTLLFLVLLQCNKQKCFQNISLLKFIQQILCICSGKWEDIHSFQHKEQTGNLIVSFHISLGFGMTLLKPRWEGVGRDQHVKANYVSYIRVHMLTTWKNSHLFTVKPC